MAITAPARARLTSHPRRRHRFSFTPYALVGLATLYVLAFAAVPLVKGIDLSFTDTRLLRPTGGRYIGLDNYVDLLSSGSFLKSVVTTLVYTFFCVVLCLLIGTFTAVIINREFPGRTVARGILVMPWAVPTVAVALVFRWIYNDQSGIANATTSVLGLGTHGLLTYPDYGMLSVIVATVWKITPFVMLVVLAALQAVPDELYEAARVDGSRGWTTFSLIVLPYLMPTLRVVGLLITIWSFRRFEIIWLLTGGGPVDATNTIVIHVYREAFANSRLGMAAAAGVLGLVLALVVTVVYFIIENRQSRTAGEA